MARIGGRGCPSCGSHDTEGVSRAGIQVCISCAHRWFPCSPGCRGYRLEPDADPPRIIGCPDCGVPDRIAWQWPEAWRGMMYRLAGRKLESLTDAFPPENKVSSHKRQP